MCIWSSESLTLISCSTSYVTSSLPTLHFFSSFFSQCAVSIFSLSCLLVCLFSLMLFSRLHYLSFYLSLSLLCCRNFPFCPVSLSASRLSCDFIYLPSLSSSHHTVSLSASLPASLITLTLLDYTTCAWLPFAPPHRI